jgi:H+-transporting ATPase
MLVVAKGIVNRVLKTNETDGGVQWTCADFEAISEQVAKDDKEFASNGYKTVGVGVSNGGILEEKGGKKVLKVKEGTMKFIGLLPIQDPPRHDTPQTIEAIRNKHVYVKMCTGDHLNIAKEVGRQIGLGSNIMPNTELHTNSAQKEDKVLEADGFAQVLPMDKTEVVAILQNKGMVVGMTGDGVNDAPALAKAQIGIAVEGATEAAKSAADIVLTKEGLSAIDVAVNISRRIFKRLKSYVIYRICITVQVVFFLTAIAFISGDSFKALYIILLALLHDLQIVTIAYDLQVEGPKPETPTVLGLLLVSYTMGLTMCLQTVLMYYNGDQFLAPEFADGGAYKDAAMFLQISNSSAILIFSARSVKWWFSTKPAWQIMFSAAIGQVIVVSIMLFPSDALSSYIHKLALVDIGYIFAYDLVWLFLLDVVKQGMMHLWDGYEEAHADPDPLARMNKKAANSVEPNVPGRKASFKRPSQTKR